MQPTSTSIASVTAGQYQRDPQSFCSPTRLSGPISTTALTPRLAIPSPRSFQPSSFTAVSPYTSIRAQSTNSPLTNHPAPALLYHSGLNTPVAFSSVQTNRSSIAASFMQNDQPFYPVSSPLAPQSAVKRPAVVPALPIHSLKPSLGSNQPGLLGGKTSPLVASPRTPTIYPINQAVQPQSALLVSPRETVGRPEHFVGVGLSSYHALSQSPRLPPIRMNGYQEGRALVSNGPIQAHPGAFQSNPHPSPPQLYPDATAGRWTQHSVHQLPSTSHISSKPQTARSSVGPHSSTPSYQSPVNSYTSTSSPIDVKQQQPFASPTSVYAYRPQPTVHSPYSNHPLVSPRVSQGPFHFPDNRPQGYVSSPLVQSSTYNNSAPYSPYPSQSPMPSRSTGDQHHYVSRPSGGVATSNQVVRTPRGPQAQHPYQQQQRHAEIPGNAAPRYSHQHTTSPQYTATTVRSRPSPTNTYGMGGASGAMTARESTSTSKQHHFANNRTPVGSARQHTPMSQMSSAQWSPEEGSARGRGGRGVLGKFLESLKSTLGMHGANGTPIGKREAEPPAQETRRPKSKTPFPASSSVTTPRDDRMSPRAEIQSIERPIEVTRPLNAPQKASGDSPVVHYQSQQSSNSFMSTRTQTSEALGPAGEGGQADQHHQPPQQQQQSPPEEHETASPAASKDSHIAAGASPSASTHKSGGSPRLKPPRLNLSAVLASNQEAAPATPSAEDKPSSDRFSSSSSPNGQSYHTPMNSTSSPMGSSTEHYPSSSAPITPGSSVLSPVVETPAAFSATEYDAKTPGAITPPGVGGSRNYDTDNVSKQSSLQKYRSSKISQDSSGRTSIQGAPKPVRFSWIVARALIKLQMQPAETFSLNGVPWPLWELHKIPTLGASPTSCRVQEMYKVTIPPATPTSKRLRVFVKSIPVNVWRKQWESQNKWTGEYVTDGENFVMEAAALAFLQQYGPDLAPRLLGVLELSGPVTRNSKSQRRKTSQTQRPDSFRGETATEVTHVVIVSELYGEDLLDFLERREKEKIPLTDSEKKSLQLDCICLLKRLHHLGLAHLDFTPENVLYGRHGLRLCDFAKATPVWSNNFRHVKADSSHGLPPFPFESCEPTVGKGAYMPPECWKVYWRLEDTRIQYPLEELWSLTKPVDRTAYYFRVDRADVYMAGVLLFWLWSEGGIWKCSDVKQDEKYNHLVKSSLNFDLFRECRSWPAELKDILRSALRPDPRQRTTLEELINHNWFLGCTPSHTSRERWLKMASFSNPPSTIPSHISVNEGTTSQSELLSNRVEAAH